MGWRRVGGLAAITVVIAAIAAGVVWTEGRDRFERPGPLSEQSIVMVPPGSGLESIAQLLEDNDVIDDKWVFRIGVRLLGLARSLKAGEYAFPAAVSMRDAVGILESGEVVVRRLTIVEGISSHEAAALIEAAEALEGSLTEVPPEGALLPETYHYRRGDSRDDLLKRMRTARDRVLAELWENRAPDLPIKTPEEAVILASIVEKETGSCGGARPGCGCVHQPSEKGHAAAVRPYGHLRHYAWVRRLWDVISCGRISRSPRPTIPTSLKACHRGRLPMWAARQ